MQNDAAGLPCRVTWMNGARTVSMTVLAGQERTDAGGGRRREALVKHGAELLYGNRLTIADVAILQRDRSSTARALIAGKVGRQLDGLATPAERALATAVLELLVRDVAGEVRRALAEAVAGSRHLPPAVAAELVHDEIAVARPILERSPVLDDATLIEVVRTNTLQYALAVAGRQEISAPVADSLVETGEQVVVTKLVGNLGAELSRSTLQRIHDDFKADLEVHERLVRRPELPPEIIEQLVAAIGERIEWDLVETQRLSAEQAHAIVTAARNRATLGLAAREHSDRRLSQRLTERFEAGLLDHDDLLRFLRDGEVLGLELGLAIHAGFEPSATRDLLYAADRRHLAALCIAAGFSTPHYIALRLALDLAQSAVNPREGGPAFSPETIRYLRLQYEQLRQDAPRLRQLLGR